MNLYHRYYLVKDLLEDYYLLHLLHYLFVLLHHLIPLLILLD